MPTSYAVLDSGILLATARTETNTAKAEALIKHLSSQKIQIAAPVLLTYEIVAVTRKWIYRSLMTVEDARTARDILLSIPFEVHYDIALLKRAFELATIHNRPTAYDSQYLVVAEKLNCDFWTADERLFNAVKDKFSPIRWIQHFELDDALTEDSET